MVTPDRDVSRVAQVVGALLAAPDRARLGTGYRISDRLVLTACHVLDGTGDVEADLGGDGDFRPVTPVWRDPVRDLALLRFDTPPDTRVSPIRLGGVRRDRAAEIAARALGHPKYAEILTSGADGRTRSVRGRASVRCSVHSAEEGPHGMLRVHIHDAPPAPTAPGDSPWKGMSGAAVITEDTGLLVAVFRSHVHATGPGMHQVTALDQVDDEEWEALLRAEGVDPRPAPALPVGWDRTGGTLQPHHVRKDEYRDRQEALFKGKAPFVDPEDASSPENVLDRLTALADRRGLPAGVVLTGEPGAGKSRLCLETAELADARGWLVVHLTRETSLTAVWESVRELADRVLVVADDVDWIAEPGETFRELCYDARAENVRLAVLTGARRLRLKDLESEPLSPQTTFEEIRVRWDTPYHSAICREMVPVVAPNAVDQKGESYVRDLCGGSPTEIQLYASYCDDLALNGVDLGGADPHAAPDFRSWIRTLLDAAGVPAVSWKHGPAPVTTAVALITAHAPCPLHVALDFFAPDSQDPADRERREQGVATILQLEASGLIHQQDDRLSPKHDHYADLLLAHGVTEADGARLNGTGLRRVLDTALTDSASLLRVVTSVDRLASTLDAPLGDRITQTVGDWCAARPERLRELVLTDPDGRGEVLQALLKRRTWRAVAARELARPWLAEYHRRPGAFDAVMTAARHLPSEVCLPYLLGQAEEHPFDPRTAIVFHQILTAARVDPATRRRTEELAHEWLARHAHRHIASLPLRPLLDPRKRGLPRADPRLPRLVGWALRWLRRYGTTREAGFVAAPLVMRPELTGPALERTARLLLDRVAPGDPAQASYAYEPVLVRNRRHRDLPKDVFDQAVRDSLAWLLSEEGHGLRPEAAYVLKELITGQLPGRDTLPRAVQAGWNWLEANADRDLELGMVLPLLLTNSRKSGHRTNAALTEDEQRRLAGLAVDWLARHDGTGQSVRDVLSALLHTRLLDDDHDLLHQHAWRALKLVERQPEPTVARALLPPLLHKPRLDDDLRAGVMAALFDQLTPERFSEHLAYPLTSFFQRRDLSPAEHGPALEATLAWLDAHPGAPGAPMLLTTALKCALTSPAERGLLAPRAVRSLSLRVLVTSAGTKRSLTHALAEHRAVIRPEWNRYVGRACDLLQETPPTTGLDVMRALTLMLEGSDELEDGILERLHTACLDWCAAYDGSGKAVGPLCLLLGSRGLTPAARRRATEVVLHRFRPGFERNDDSGKLLEALLRDGHLPDTEAVGQVLDLALDWLEVRQGRRHGTRHPLLLQVAHRLQHVSGRHQADQARRARDGLDSWLGDHADAPAGQRRAAEHHRDRLTGLLDGGPAT
ncbi:trypsin-like peptidase domain-containing protein [Streptomyces sp. 7R007]